MSKHREISDDFHEEYKRRVEKNLLSHGSSESQQQTLPRLEIYITERDAGWNVMDACSNHGGWLD